MDDAKQQLLERLKTANNVLVTVTRNPSVDQLAACIGLTLLLNKQGKHAAAVFSGEVPSTLEFLQPEETIEKNTDSLRDFIISLDKTKADKLRYKVEDNVVRIFITPYKTSLSQDDLEFSEGDFNVDLVIALGVQRQEDLDEAITAHGRILHDATVTSINISTDGGGVGTINWNDPQASSLCEIVTDLSEAVNDQLLDNQIATALLTGIVAETKRFSSDKTSSQTMNTSALLMAAGANPQLVASKLEEGSHNAPPNPDNPDDGPDQTDKPHDDGALQIDHGTDSPPEPPPGDSNTAASEPDNNGNANTPSESAEPLPPPPSLDQPASGLSPGGKLITEPPTMGGTLSANTRQEGLDPTTDPFSLPASEPPQLLNHKPPAPPPSFAPLPAPSDQPPPGPGSNLSPPPATAAPSDDNQTLTEIEAAVDSPHSTSENVESARDEVNRALTADPAAAADDPIQALNAQPLGNDLHPPAAPAAPDDPNAPPPVPPPIPFQFNSPS